MILFRDLFRRLLQSRRWIAAQFIATALLILIAIVWTRLPEKHVWQVLLSLLVPLLLAASALALQAATMRSLANDDGKRVKLVWGAISLLVWIGVAWLCWAILDWCDDQISQWAGYLNSQAPAHWRAKFLTYQHLSLWMTYIEWVFRWIVVPAKVIPFAIASAQSGWRLPVRRVLQLLWNWRWWLGATIIALVSVLLPGHFYSADPHGTIHAQAVRIALKLAASYLLGVGGWLLLLAWFGVLFGCQKPLPESDALTEFFDRLYVSRRAIAAVLGLILLYSIGHWMSRLVPDDTRWKLWITVPLGVVILVVIFVVQVVLVRRLLTIQGNRVRLVWGVLSTLLWCAIAVAFMFALDLLKIQLLKWLLENVAVPAVFAPFAAVSAVQGLRLPWRRVLRVVGAWRWWRGVFLTVLAMELVEVISNNFFSTPAWVADLNIGAASLLMMGIWVLLLGWFAVLFNRTLPPAKEEPAAASTPVSAV